MNVAEIAAALAATEATVRAVDLDRLGRALGWPPATADAVWKAYERAIAAEDAVSAARNRTYQILTDFIGLDAVAAATRVRELEAGSVAPDHKFEREFLDALEPQQALRNVWAAHVSPATSMAEASPSFVAEVHRGSSAAAAAAAAGGAAAVPATGVASTAAAAPGGAVAAAAAAGDDAAAAAAAAASSAEPSSSDEGCREIELTAEQAAAILRRDGKVRRGPYKPHKLADPHRAVDAAEAVEEGAAGRWAVARHPFRAARLAAAAALGVGGVAGGGDADDAGRADARVRAADGDDVPSITVVAAGPAGGGGGGWRHKHGHHKR